MKSAKDARTASRLLDPPASINSDTGDDWDSRPTCQSCHWSVLQTRRFRGRMLCLSCIAEFFDVDGEDAD
jgi:hypothetical protein